MFYHFNTTLADREPISCSCRPRFVVFVVPVIVDFIVATVIASVLVVDVVALITVDVVTGDVITTFLNLILNLNNFIFHLVNYIQKMGCAIGNVCAPSYAILFIAEFEEKHIYPYIKAMSLLYLKCIDDIFIIWKGTKEQLITFINKLNKKHKAIKFEYEISSQKIPFLDTMVYKDKENNLQVTLYQKSTDQQSYLHAK